MDGRSQQCQCNRGGRSGCNNLKRGIGCRLFFDLCLPGELKNELEGIGELRFIFTSPTYLQEKTPKEKREFSIHRLNRERSLYGTEFEIKLRNELTQKAIDRECADWIREKSNFD